MKTPDEDILAKCIEDGSSEKELEQLFFTLQLAKRLKAMKNADATKAFEQFKVSIRQKRKKLGFRLGLERAAAILFIPLLVVSGYLLTRDSGPGRLRMVEINTNPGVVSTYELPDGTKVWLNANSSLTCAADFDQKRRAVTLDGEAFFEVAKNTGKPFVVETGTGCSVEVLGTTFNISAYRDDNVVSTTLLSGLVKLNWKASDGSTQSRNIRPSEKAEYEKEKQELTVGAVNPELSTSWKQGELVFRQEPMAKALKTLSRHYNVTFDVKDPAVMKSLLTARFSNEQLPQVMEYLKTALKIKYTIKLTPVNDTNIVPQTVVEIGK